MEDILLGRKTQTSFSVVTMGATPQPLVPRNKSRIALIIGDPSASAVTFSMSPNVVANGGLTQHAGNSPIILNIQQHGNIVTEELFGVAGAGTPTIAIAEVTLPDGS